MVTGSLPLPVTYQIDIRGINMTASIVTLPADSRWTVIGKSEKKHHFDCVCECGVKKSVYKYSLAKGKSLSCGCLFLEIVSTHRANCTPEYFAWASMIQRCTNPNHPGYNNYGGRGISICKEWRESFETFRADMGFRPSPKHSIDRIDNDGNYGPGNCRWATTQQQSRNKRPKLGTASGERGVTRNKKRWSATIGLNGKQLHLGTYPTIDQAAQARKQAEAKYWHGEEEADTQHC